MSDLEIIILLDGWSKKSSELYWRLDKGQSGVLLEFKKFNEFKYDDIVSIQRLLDKFNTLINFNDALEIEVLIYNDMVSEIKYYMNKNDISYAFNSLVKLIRTFMT